MPTIIAVIIGENASCLRAGPSATARVFRDL